MLSKSPAFTDEQLAACLAMVKSLMTSPRTSYEDFQAIGPAAGVFAGPEFADWKGVHARYGLTRSHLYALLAEGKIRSACIRRPGALRGRRIFDLASIRRFIDANVEVRAQGAEHSTQRNGEAAATEDQGLAARSENVEAEAEVH